MQLDESEVWILFFSTGLLIATANSKQHGVYHWSWHDEVWEATRSEMGLSRHGSRGWSVDFSLHVPTDHKKIDSVIRILKPCFRLPGSRWCWCWVWQGGRCCSQLLLRWTDLWPEGCVWAWTHRCTGFQCQQQLLIRLFGPNAGPSVGALGL